MTPIPVFVPRTSPRLAYVLDWLFGEQLGTGYRLVTDPAEAEALPRCIVYGISLLARAGRLHIPDAGLLWQRHSKGQTLPRPELRPGSWHGLPVIFSAQDNRERDTRQTRPADEALPFDLFSALFFHLSRYEEYFSYTPDKHGRYPATESICYKTGHLERPLADEWIQAFRELLQREYPLAIPEKAFSFQPTYDIDIAWSYKYKGWKRTAGAVFKDLLRGKTAAVNERLSVLSGRQEDPYDAFSAMQDRHRQYRLKPYYFILSALHTTAFDKNIPLRHPAMQTLIRQLAADGIIGIHPSYYSEKYPARLHAEKERLERILPAREKITCSRQHYIKMNIPSTCRLLLAAGITDDFSMGYGTHLGFRAATGQSFPWYDLENETATTLRIHPFCFMDTTARYDAGLSPAAAFKKLEEMATRLRAAHSRLITVFHNFSLGEDRGWEGWWERYRDFILLVSSSQ